MVHTAGTCKTAAQASMSAAATPVSAAVGGVSATGATAPYVYPSTACPTAHQRAGLRLFQQQQGRPQQCAYPPCELLCAPETVERSPINAAPTAQHHPLHFAPRQLDGDSDDQNPLHIPGSALLQTNKGRTSAVGGEFQIQRRRAESVQRAHQSQVLQLQTQTACTLKRESYATFTGAKPCLHAYPASVRQRSLSPALLQSSTHEHEALDAQKHFQRTQHRQLRLREHLNTQQALISHPQSFPQEPCILEHPQLKSQQPQGTQQKLDLEEQRAKASPGGSQCKDTRQYSNPWECSGFNNATQRQHISSPKGDAGLRGSCKPPHQQDGRIEHDICQQQRSKWLLTFCDKHEAVLFYVSESTKARASSASCSADAVAPRCLTSACREKEPARADCSRHTDLLDTGTRNQSRLLVEKDMSVARIAPLDTQKIDNMQLTVERVVTKPTQDVKAFPSAHISYNEQFNDVRGVRGSICRHGVPVQHQLSLRQQPVSCKNGEMIQDSGNGTEALQLHRKVTKADNTLMGRIAGVGEKSEMAGDKIRCNSGISGNASGEETADETKVRQCLISGAANEPLPGIFGETTAATSYEAERQLPADDPPRRSVPPRVLTPHAAAPRQDPACRGVDTTAQVPTGGRSASAVNARNTAIQWPHSAELNSTSLLLHPALTEALLVPPTVNHARGTAACGEPPSLLAVHVAVVKPRIPNPTYAYESRGSIDEKAGSLHRESKPHALPCNFRRCNGGCLRAGDSATFLTHSKDSIDLATLRSESRPVRSASSPGFLPGKQPGICGHRIADTLCSRETTSDGSSSCRLDSARNSIETSSRSRPGHGNNSYTPHTSHNYFSRLTVVASNTLSPRQVDHLKSLYVDRGADGFDQRGKSTRLTQAKSGEDTEEGRHHQELCKREVQTATELFRSETAQPCRKSAGQSKTLFPKSCPSSRERRPARCGDAVSTDILVNDLVLSPLASEHAVVKGMLVQSNGGVQSPVLKRASEVANSGVRRVSLDCSSKSDTSVRAHVPAGRSTGCEEGKHDGLTDAATADPDEGDSPNAEGNKSSSASPSAIEIIPASGVPAGAEVVASVVNTPAGSTTLSTQHAPAANTDLDIFNAHSEAGFSCVSLAEEQTADDEEKAATTHTLNSTNEDFFEAHRSFSASTTSSRVNGNASTLGHAHASVQLIEQHESQPLDTRQLFWGALTIPGPQHIPLPYLEIPVEVMSSEAAGPNPESVLSPSQDDVTAYSSDKRHQTCSSRAASPQQTRGEPVGREAQVTSQDVPAQVLSMPHFSDSSAVEVEDGSRVTSTLLERPPHQVDAQPRNPQVQQLSVDHRILQRPRGQHEWAKEEQTQSNQARHQQQTNVEQSQQRTPDQLHQHQQQSCQSPDPLGQQASPTKTDTEHSQKRLYPEDKLSGLEALFLDACCIEGPPDAHRNIGFRRIHSMSCCTKSHRVCCPFVRAQREAAVTRSKSLPSGEDETLRLRRALGKCQAGIGEQWQSGQDKQAHTEVGLRSKVLQDEPQQTSLHVSRHQFDRKFQDKCASLFAGKVKDWEPQVLQSTCLEGTQSSAKVQSGCAGKTADNCIKTRDRATQSTENSQEHTTWHRNTDPHALKDVCKHSFLDTATKTVAPETLLRKPPDFLDAHATGSPSTSEKVVCRVRARGPEDDGAIEDGTGAHVPAGAADGIDLTAPKESGAAAAAVEALSRVKATAKQRSAEPRHESDATSAEQCVRCEGSEVTIISVQAAHAEAAEHKRRSHTNPIAIESSLHTATVTLPGAEEARESRAVDLSNDSTLCVTPTAVTGTPDKSTLHIALVAAGAQGNKRVSRQAVTPRQTSLPLETCNGTYIPVTHNPLLGPDRTGSQISPPGDATESMPEEQHSSDESSPAVGSSAATPTRKNPPPAAHSTSARADATRHTQHSLALAVYAKLLAMGLLPIESVSTATAEWLHASFRGFHGNSQPPAEACKQIVAALASVACAAEDDGRRSQVDVHQSLRSATVAPPRAQKRKEESRRRTLTRLRLQRTRAAETSDSTDIASSLMQRRRDWCQRQRLRDLYCGDRRQQLSNKEAPQERYLMLLSRLQEKVDERLRPLTAVHSPSPTNSSTRSAAPRSAGSGSKKNLLKSANSAGLPCRLRPLETFDGASPPAGLANISTSSLLCGSREGAADVREIRLTRRPHQPVSPNAADCRRSAAASTQAVIPSQEMGGSIAAGYLGTSTCRRRYARTESTYNRRRPGSVGRKCKAWPDCRTAEISPPRMHAQSRITEAAARAVKRDHRHYDRQTTLLLTHDGLFDGNCSATSISKHWDKSETQIFADVAGRAAMCSCLTQDSAQIVDCCEVATSLRLQHGRNVAPAAQLLRRLHPLQKQQEHNVAEYPGEGSGQEQRQQELLYTEVEQEVLQKQPDSPKSAASQVSQSSKQQQQAGKSEDSETVCEGKFISCKSCADQREREQGKKFAEPGEFENSGRCSRGVQRMYEDSPRRALSFESSSLLLQSPFRQHTLASTKSTNVGVQSAGSQNRSALQTGFTEAGAASAAEKAVFVETSTDAGALTVTEADTVGAKPGALAVAVPARAAIRVEATADKISMLARQPQGSTREGKTPFSQPEKVPFALHRARQPGHAPVEVVAAGQGDNKVSRVGLQLGPVEAAKTDTVLISNAKSQMPTSKVTVPVTREKESCQRQLGANGGRSCFIKDSYSHPSRLQNSSTLEGRLDRETKSREEREQLLLSAAKPIFSGICPPALKEALRKRGWEENPDGLSSFFHLRWLPTVGALAQLKDLARAEMYAATPGVQSGSSWDSSNSSKNRSSNTLCERNKTGGKSVSSARYGNCRFSKDNKTGNSTARAYGKSTAYPTPVSAAPFLSGFSLWMVTRKNVALSDFAIRTKGEDEPLLRCQITNSFPDTAALTTRGLLLRHLQRQMPFFFDKLHLQITPRAYVLNLEEDIAALRDDFTLTQAECVLKLFLLSFFVKQAEIQAAPRSFLDNDGHKYKILEQSRSEASACQISGFSELPPASMTSADDSSVTHRLRGKPLEETAQTTTMAGGVTLRAAVPRGATKIAGSISESMFSATSLANAVALTAPASPKTPVLSTSGCPAGRPFWTNTSTEQSSALAQNMPFPERPMEDPFHKISFTPPRSPWAENSTREEAERCTIDIVSDGTILGFEECKGNAFQPVVNSTSSKGSHTVERDENSLKDSHALILCDRHGQDEMEKGVSKKQPFNDRNKGTNGVDASPEDNLSLRKNTYSTASEGMQPKSVEGSGLRNARKRISGAAAAAQVEYGTGGHIKRDDWVRRLFHQKGSNRIEEAIERLHPRSVKAAIYVTSRARAHQSRSVERFDCPFASPVELRHLEAAPLRLLSALDMSEADYVIASSLQEILHAPEPAALHVSRRREAMPSYQTHAQQYEEKETCQKHQQDALGQRRHQHPDQALRGHELQRVPPVQRLQEISIRGVSNTGVEKGGADFCGGVAEEKKYSIFLSHHSTGSLPVELQQNGHSGKTKGDCENRREKWLDIKGSKREKHCLREIDGGVLSERVESRRGETAHPEAPGAGDGGGETSLCLHETAEEACSLATAEGRIVQWMQPCVTQKLKSQRNCITPRLADLPALVKEAAGALAWLRSRQPSLSQFFMNGWTNKWILKSADGRGRQFQCVHDRLTDVEKTMRQKYGPQLLAQKFVEAPLLLQGRSFILRQWVLVTCWNPLTVWTYRKNLVRITGGPEGAACNRYLCEDPINSLSRKNSFKQGSPFTRCVHEYDSSNSRKADCTHQTGNTAVEPGGFSAAASTFARWSASLQDWMEVIFGEDLWQTVLYPQIKCTVAEVCKCVQQEVVGRENSHELFSFDFTVDATMKPWLLDVGRCPEFGTVSSTRQINRLISVCLEDVLKVVLDWTAAENEEKKRRVDTGLFELVLRETVGKDSDTTPRSCRTL